MALRVNHKTNCKCLPCRCLRGETSGKNNPFYGKKHSHSEETKRKISLSKKGQSHPQSTETRLKISIANKGRIFSEEHRRKIGEAEKGEKHPHFGKTMEEIHNKGCKCHFCLGAKRQLIGILNSSYIDGRTPLHFMIRNLLEYKEWKNKVFKRDNYTCQSCGEKGYIEAHHKLSFSLIFQDFLDIYKQFSPSKDKIILIKLAIKYQPFWNVENGKTLCEKCHNKTKSQGVTGKWT